jgi:hypothetical protein
VYFTSFDRQPTDTNTDFSVTFDTPIQNAYNFEVVQASFPNLLYPFARYETILYIYHEDFFGGNIALGIPLSTTLFAGATGEALPVTSGREVYIDKRFFADGTALATYLTDWIQSLDTAWPSLGTGLSPFFFINDNPYGTPSFYPTNTTGITFANLAFTYDDLTANGTLKLTLTDSTPKTVRVASTFDYGDLNSIYPSQLGYKLGYTLIQPESFGAGIATVTPANNQFTISAGFSQVQVLAPNNQFAIYATSNPVLRAIVDIPEGNYDLDELCDVLQIAMNQAKQDILPIPNAYDAFCSPSGGAVQIGLQTNISGESWNIDFTSAPEWKNTANTLGFAPVNQTGVLALNVFTAGNPPVYATVIQSTTATIPPNEYTVTALAATIQATIELLPPPYQQIFQGTTVTQGGGILTFTFATGGQQQIDKYAIDFDPTPAQQGAKTLLGFVDDANVVSPPTLIAPNAVVVTTQTPKPDFAEANDQINLTRTSLVYFASSLSSGESLASAGRKDILFAVAMTAGLGQIQQFQSSLTGILINRPPSTIRTIRVTLLDDNFQVLEPIPQNASIVAEVHFAYNEDAKANTIDRVTTNRYA